MKKILILFAILAVASFAYSDYSDFTSNSFSGDITVVGDITGGTYNLGDELLADTADFSGDWTLAGDFDLATLAFEYNDSAHSGTLTQANADFSGTLVASTWYLLRYTLTDATTAVDGTITAALGTSSITIKLSTAQTYYYLIESDATVTGDDFVITVATSTTGDIAGSLVSLKKVDDSYGVFETLSVDRFSAETITGGIVYTDSLEAATTDANITFNSDANFEKIESETDGGFKNIIDHPLATSSTKEGGSFSVGSNNIISYYGTGDGAADITAPTVEITGTLTVSDTINTIGGITCFTTATSMIDTGKIDLTAASIGWGHIVAGDNAANAYFTFKTDGTVVLEDNLNCTTTEDNDTTFNIFDSGAGIGFNNELGSTVTVLIEVHYITP